MRSGPVAAVAVLAALAAAAGPAAAMVMDDHPAGGPTISIGFAAFATPRLDVLAGDTVTWMNDSTRAHDVVAADQSFDSGRLVPTDHFARRFDDEQSIPYYCSIHPGMTGEIDVHDVLLDTPTQRGGSNKPFVLTGRAAPGLNGSVSIEGDDGSGFRPAGSAAIGPDGGFRATVVPRTTTTYRAAVGDHQSPAVQLLVLDHTVTVSAARQGRSTTLTVTVAPAAPGQLVVLQLRLRDRFGWWPVQQARLDAASTARLTVARRSVVPARVLLTQADGATELARSRTVHVGRR